MPNLFTPFLLVLSSVILVPALAFAAGEAEFGSNGEKNGYGKIGVYELSKGNVSMKLTNWGATVMSLVLPDKHGKLTDVVLGFDSAFEYKNDTSYFGSIVGRVANRIANARFKLNGVLYKLVPNEGKNMLHGGPKGFSDLAWKVIKYKNGGRTPHIVFGYNSCDGEEGFPGNLEVAVTYKLIGDDRLSVMMKGKALDKPTPVNLAQHTYWNLGGHNSGDILSNKVQIFAHSITPVDSHLIPTGKIVPIKGTPYDFLRPRTVGSRIQELTSGYDINYVIDGAGGERRMRKTATVHCERSGRVMELWTNQPGVQFYTSNALGDTRGKGGYVYKKHAGLCLETQKFPDSVNHPNFPSEIVYPGKPYLHLMLYKFSTV
ncbi:hypothetical protein MLD38_013171 [Melastoma candidum]|uniref:Uncharacterized protein n=1 Tax=Melastoma candidum TaxID=119954 RepID=A0ACB9R8P0_9MYRT|nr:hypothetical protein MLD38_013171 [Melastoma candidum]